MKIALLTRAFPFYIGEQFLEDEIKFWGDAPFDEIIILPSIMTGSRRDLPSNVCVNLSALSKNKFSTFFFSLLALMSSIFYKELKYILRSGGFSFRTVVISLAETSKTIKTKVYLKKFLTLHPEVRIVYCYWNTYVSYAACILKKEGLIDTLVSRVHGFDLYEERRENSYMPIKRQFISDFDVIFTLSSEGVNYIKNQYGAPEKILRISSLGVPLLDHKQKMHDKNKLHIVSVSFCTPIKRIDKIIGALATFSKENSHICIKWTHIGDGPLLQKMQNLALELLTNENITFCFKGLMNNEDVRQYYMKENIDIFINASESEGVPVSIMEAMSSAVPAIAPNVGGISYLVSNENGILLSSTPTIEEIKNAINEISLMNSKQILVLRRLAREKIDKNFNANKNYKCFIQEVYDIASKNIKIKSKKHESA